MATIRTNIYNRKIQDLLDNIIQEYIKKGIMPDTDVVFSDFLEKKVTIKPNSSYFEPAFISRGERFDPIKIKNIISPILKDFEILYNSAVEFDNILNNSISYFNIKTAELEKRLKKIEDEVVFITNMTASSKYLNYVGDSFTSMDKIDIQSSTISADVTSSEIGIPYDLSTVRKNHVASLLKLQIHDDKVIKDVKTFGNIEDIFNEGNEMFSVKLSSVQDYGAALKLHFDFMNPIDCNKIELDLPNSTTIGVVIEYSSDYGKNYFNIRGENLQYNIDRKRSITFDKTDITNLNIYIIKFRYDEVSNDDMGNPLYMYNINIRNISFYSLDYSSEGTFVSLPLDLTSGNTNFSRASVETTYFKPQGTDIEFYISKYQEGKDPDWIRISALNDIHHDHPTVIDFTNISDKQIYCNINKDKPFEQEISQLYNNGIKFYGLTSINENIKNIQVLKGINNSLLEIMPSSNDLIPYIQDFKPASISYYQINQGDILSSIKPDYNCVVKTTIMFNVTHTNKTRLLHINIPYKTSVYVNNELIFSYSDTDTLKTIELKNLIIGQNSLTILSYVSSGSEYKCNIGFDMIKEFGEVYALNMTKVDIFELTHKVLSSDNSKYALYTYNGKTYIVVNNNSSLKYKIIYSYSIEKIEKLLFKAVLKRTPFVNTTPYLKGYVIYLS